MATREPKKRRRDRGDGSITWDKINKCYTGRISLGYKGDGTRNRPTVRGRTKTEVKEKLDAAARGDQRRRPPSSHLHS